ncbi:MAG TPA: RagB/SusD family nutrient uptake outer membrane protein, partial [Puia sp.]|nr:RagB/SusD family nutrient uptake outer membrane protein [Puia sp.]
LPVTVPSSSELGRVTSVIAKAIKARLFLYAASPLCNGNGEYYSSFKNMDGQPLMNLTYDPGKWKRAADAALDAIQAAQATGVKLYTSSLPASTPAQKAQNNYRYSMVDPWNSELVWGYSMPEPFYGWQRHSMPRVSGQAYNGNSPTLKIVETYYTSNGLPIDVDPGFDYANRYQISGNTIVLHQNREPRFYASIAYDRGIYQANATNMTMYFRGNEANGQSLSSPLSDYSPTGYLVQKGVHPNSIITTSQNQVINYPWPIVRLAELYLDYAEALNEYDGINSQSTVLQYIDPIRIRSGIPGVAASWSLVGKTSFSQDEMRSIIRQERMIELAFEGHRCWDLRRWKLGAAYLNVPVYGMNIQGATAVDFYQPAIVEKRLFNTPGYYFFPISINDLSINKNLVQNPGW